MQSAVCLAALCALDKPNPASSISRRDRFPCAADKGALAAASRGVRLAKWDIDSSAGKDISLWGT